MSQVIGFVRRAKDRKATAFFYELLDLDTYEHRHGGPLHFAVTPVSNECILEIYSESENFNTDAVMIEVGDLKMVLDNLLQINVVPHRIVEEDKMVYVKDPDGRDIILIQSE